MREVLVEAPASSANLGPGFDVFALALEEPRDRILLSTERSEKLSVEIQQMKGTPTPLDARKNGAGAVVLSVARDFGILARIRIRLWKNVRIGVGMGSSAASAAAAAVGVNEVFGLAMKKRDLTFYAGKGERVTSGAAHYDNVAASIAGGFVIVARGDRPDPVSFRAPRGMSLCIATPRIRLPARKTEYARSILPKSVELRRAVENVAHASMIVAGFALGDIDLIGKGMEDRIVEAARKRLVPGYELVKDNALKAGASGVCISGAGPSMLAIVKGSDRAKKVLRAMRAAFREAGVQSNGFVTRAGGGARVVKNS